MLIQTNKELRRDSWPLQILGKVRSTLLRFFGGLVPQRAVLWVPRSLATCLDREVGSSVQRIVAEVTAGCPLPRSGCLIVVGHWL